MTEKSKTPTFGVRAAVVLAVVGVLIGIAIAASRA